MAARIPRAASAPIPSGINSWFGYHHADKVSARLGGRDGIGDRGHAVDLDDHLVILPVLELLEQLGARKI
jgi:hypothetical protein